MPAYDKADIERRMHGAVESLKHDLGGLRTGRANTSLLDPIQVEVYGANMPLNQVATVTVPEARMLQVSVWDRSMAPAVDKAIRNSGLGLNPATEGAIVVVDAAGTIRYAASTSSGALAEDGARRVAARVIADWDAGR